MEDQKDNVYKQTHGTKGIDSLEKMIIALKERNYIIDSKSTYRINDPQYKEKQFYFQFLVEFRDHEKWVLQHTTSLRDRIKQQQWDALNIKRIDETVKKAFVVVPDGLKDKERKAVEAYDKKIREKIIYSALDGVVPFQEMYTLIEKKATSIMGAGQAHATLGLNFEKKLVDSLNNEQNFERWKNESKTDTGYLYDLYKDVLSKVGVDKAQVLSVEATSNIPKLPSGGSPKTDVLMKINSIDGRKTAYTFSCKRSTVDKVSVHEYTADAFSNVLNPNDEELRKLLSEFQAGGGIKSMEPSRALALEKIMKQYDDKLTKWVLAGIGGEGDPQIQWASYIITVHENTNEYIIRTIDEYIAACKEAGVEGQFGTLFNWTYPSKGKGKRIQLKGKMI